MQMLNAARPVDDWLGDAQASEQLKSRLALSQRIRSFAVSELKLPDNPSYRRYADLRRSAVVWNVVAAPEFSLTLKTWCFPVTGCVGYRGYFNEAEARAEADRLKAQGLETSVYGVPAYSTLGWMNWAGGDPLLNTFIGYPEGELARLIFHELAHQVVYAKDDTMFNESFATAVERLGSQRWLDSEAAHGNGKRQDYVQFDGRRRQFRALALATRLELAAYLWPKARDGSRQSRAGGAEGPGAPAFSRRLRRAQGILGRLRGLRPLGGARQQRGLRRTGRL
jgi:predicted aminopeptidase